MKAVLSWYVQKFIAIGCGSTELQQNKFTIKFEMGWKGCQWNRPLIDFTPIPPRLVH